MMLCYGAMVGLCWGAGAFMVWPASASPMRGGSTGAARSRRQCGEALTLLWTICLVGMTSGFGVFGIFQFWLEQTLASAWRPPASEDLSRLAAPLPTLAESLLPPAAAPFSVSFVAQLNASLPGLSAAAPAAPAAVVAAVSVGCTSCIMFGRPLSGLLYDHIGARRYLLLLMGTQASARPTFRHARDTRACVRGRARRKATWLQAVLNERVRACPQVLVHALLALQQLAGVCSATLGPLLVFLLFLSFAGAITTWAPLTIDLLQRPAAMPLVLTALPTAQALSAALIGTLMQVQGVLAAFRSFVCLMLLVHTFMLLARCRLLALCSEAAAPLARHDGGRTLASPACEPSHLSVVAAPAGGEDPREVVYPQAVRPTGHIASREPRPGRVAPTEGQVKE